MRSWEATSGVHARIAHAARKVVDYDLVGAPVRSYLQRLGAAFAEQSIRTPSAHPMRAGTN